MKNLNPNRHPYIKGLSIQERINLVKKALNIHYSRKMLFGLESTAKKWLYKLEIPVVDYRIDRSPWTFDFIPTIQVGHENKEVVIRVYIK